MRLTPAGERFLPAARHQLALLERSLQAARRASTDPRGVVQVGFSSSAALTPLPKVWQAFRVAHAGGGAAAPGAALGRAARAAQGRGAGCRDPAGAHRGRRLHRAGAGAGAVRGPAAGAPPARAASRRSGSAPWRGSRSCCFLARRRPRSTTRSWRCAPRAGSRPPLARRRASGTPSWRWSRRASAWPSRRASVARLRLAGAADPPTPAVGRRAALFLCHTREALSDPAAGFIEFVLSRPAAGEPAVSWPVAIVEDAVGAMQALCRRPEVFAALVVGDRGLHERFDPLQAGPGCCRRQARVRRRLADSYSPS